MITITSNAARQIRQSAEQQADRKDIHLRLAARPNGQGGIEYGMGLDDQAEGDVQVVASEISPGVGLMFPPSKPASLAV